MKGAEVIKALKKKGWVEIRVKGSHHIMKKGDQIEVVPVHNKDLPVGTLMSIKKRTGI